MISKRQIIATFLVFGSIIYLAHAVSVSIRSSSNPTLNDTSGAQTKHYILANRNDMISISTTNEEIMSDQEWGFSGGDPESAEGPGPHLITYGTNAEMRENEVSLGASRTNSTNGMCVTPKQRIGAVVIPYWAIVEGAELLARTNDQPDDVDNAIATGAEDVITELKMPGITNQSLYSEFTVSGGEALTGGTSMQRMIEKTNALSDSTEFVATFPGSVKQTKLKLHAIQIKVHHPAGHQGPAESGRAYINSPKNEPVARSLFALWPNETVQIEIRGLDSLVSSLPNNFIEWKSEATGASISTTTDKLKATVSWSQTTGVFSAYKVELRIGENNYSILFNIPDVGDVSDYDLFDLYEPLVVGGYLYVGLFEFQPYERETYPNDRPHSDAIKHAAFAGWSIVQPDISDDMARIFQDAHEYKNYLDGAAAFESAMDLINNFQGREMGEFRDDDPAQITDPWSVQEWFEEADGWYDDGRLAIWWPAENKDYDGVLRASDGVEIE